MGLEQETRRMLRIYLVDDEILIAESLAHLVQHHFGDQAQVSCFTDPSALRRAFAVQPCDLLISDIRMPGMTGLELLHVLRQESAAFETIFLTGYDVFEYAFESIRENAFGYILKNESDEKVLQIVDAAAEKIWSRQAFEKSLDKARHDLSALRERHIRQTLRDALMDDTAVMPDDLLSGRKVYLLLGYLENADAQQQAVVLEAVADGIRLSPVLRPVWQEHFLLHNDLIWLYRSDRSLSQDEIYQEMCRLQRFVEDCTDGKLLLIVDYQLAEAAELPLRYRLMKREKLYNLLADGTGIASVQHMQQPFPEEAQTLQNMQKIPARFFVALEDGIDASGMLEPLFTFWESQADERPMLAMQLYLDFSAHLLSFSQRNTMLDTFPVEDMDALLLIRMPLNFKQKIPLLRAVVRKLIAACRENERIGLTRISEQVKRYVTEHRSEDLSALAIASSVGYSEAHLSRIFKEQEGMTLHSFIQQSRIEFACHLLRETHDKIYRIAQQCGYNNTAYFIRVFKNALGMTPQEFRDGRHAGSV